MPTSAYVQSALFLVLIAAALFVSAGTVAVVGFWFYVGIQLAGIVASFVLLPPDLVRERMRPGGQRPPLGGSCARRAHSAANTRDGTIAGR